MKGPLLVCFAVPQEAKPFSRNLRNDSVRVVVSGMGPRNAERVVRAATIAHKPAAVLTCGFAGALDPQLTIADIVFQTTDAHLAALAQEAGGRAVKIHCATGVAVSARDKAQLRQETGADAVEMESGVIHKLCESAGIPCATVRAISDIAAEDLPLDFNALMTADDKLSSPRLALCIAKRPQKIPALMRLGKNSALAARKLSLALTAILERWP
jgi:adenosylhomocysteine nucleosidase